MTRATWLWPVIIIISAAAACLTVFVFPASPLRPALTLWFLLVCPGMAFVRLLDITPSYLEWMLGVALSLALDTLLSALMMYAHAWSWELALLLLAMLSVGGAALQVVLAGPGSQPGPAGWKVIRR
ncbi:MAG: hypothetical protein HPY64_17245 [Anaerolineae bacterium]|nr:hypothetical protein [Anaerolineae bacterium]